MTLALVPKLNNLDEGLVVVDMTANSENSLLPPINSDFSTVQVINKPRYSKNRQYHLNEAFKFCQGK